MTKKSAPANTPATVSVSLSRLAVILLRQFVLRAELKTRKLNNGAAEIEEHIDLIIEDIVFPPTLEGRKEENQYLREEVEIKNLSLCACESARVSIEDVMKKGISFERTGSRIALTQLLSCFDIKEGEE